MDMGQVGTCRLPNFDNCQSFHSGGLWVPQPISYLYGLGMDTFSSLFCGARASSCRQGTLSFIGKRQTVVGGIGYGV